MITGNIPSDGYGLNRLEIPNIPTSGYGVGVIIAVGGAVLDEAEAVLTDFNTFVELVADLESAFEPVVEELVTETAVEMVIRSKTTLDITIGAEAATELTINETQLELDTGAETITEMSGLVADLTITDAAADATALQDDRNSAANLETDTDLAGA